MNLRGPVGEGKSALPPGRVVPSFADTEPMGISRTKALLSRILADLGDDPHLVDAVTEPEHAVPLSSALPIGTLAQASVDAAALEAAAIIEARTGTLPGVASDPRRIAAAYSSERVFQVD